MKSVFIFFITVFLLLEQQNSFSQQHTSINITLKGNFSSNPDLLAFYFEPCPLTGNMNNSLVKNAPEPIKRDQKGFYYFNYKNASHPIYFSIGIKNKKGLIDYLFKSYLAEPGDSITIKITPLKKIKSLKTGWNIPYFKSIYNVSKFHVTFSGKGAAKYECRYKADKQAILAKGIPLIINPDKDLYTIALIESLDILQTYRNRISKTAFNIIKADFVGVYQYYWYNQLLIAYSHSNKTEQINLKKLLKENKNCYYSEYISTQEKIYSIKYPTYLWYRDRVRREIYSPDSLYTLYYYLKKSYSGELRDKLLTSYLIERYTNLKQGPRLLDDALKTMEAKHYFKILKGFQKKVAVGRPAYNFSLENADGEIVHLSDFKGKVVFIDFWYTGCGACAYYYKNELSKVENAYKGRTDVAFISISIDKDRKMWLKSIEDEKFTSNDVINLYTNGEGATHPIIQHYSVISYPRPLIIDKEGKIYRFSGADLRNSDSLFQIIEKALCKK